MMGMIEARTIRVIPPGRSQKIFTGAFGLFAGRFAA
jgi:hypothetical protein